VRSTVASQDPTRGLPTYPPSAVQRPFGQRTATLKVRDGDAALVAPRFAGGDTVTTPSGAGDGLAGVFEDAAAGKTALVLLLLAALGCGALHALSPGHGKTMVAAYLVGAKGTSRHAVVLGAVVTTTHTIGVFALGLITLLLAQYILPEDLFPWLTLISGRLVVAIGLAVLRTRVSYQRVQRAHGDAHENEPAHGHSHDQHDHGHDHDHAHVRTATATTSPHDHLEGAHRHGSLRRPHPLPIGARRAARRGRPAPGRARPAAHPGLQRRPGRHPHRPRTARGTRPPRDDATQRSPAPDHRTPRRLGIAISSATVGAFLDYEPSSSSTGRCRLSPTRGCNRSSFRLKSGQLSLSFISVTTDPRCSRSLEYPTLLVRRWKYSCEVVPFAVELRGGGPVISERLRA
jgi:high-affinity nickel-transport protein